MTINYYMIFMRFIKMYIFFHQENLKKEKVLINAKVENNNDGLLYIRYIYIYLWKSK